MNNDSEKAILQSVSVYLLRAMNFTAADEMAVIPYTAGNADMIARLMQHSATFEARFTGATITYNVRSFTLALSNEFAERAEHCGMRLR